MKSLRIAIAVLLLCSLANAAVHIVDTGTPPLQTTIDNAADGDLILVYTGDYPFQDITIQGKGISMVRTGSTPVKLRSLIVRNVPAGSQTIVRGFVCGYPNLEHGPGAQLSSNSGRVWLEDCVIEGGEILQFEMYPTPAWYTLSVFDGLVATHTATLILEHCVVRGAVVTHPPYTLKVDGATGLKLDNSTADAHDCDIEGSGGVVATPTVSWLGGHGAAVSSSFLLVSGSTIEGGGGGASPGSPGHGITSTGQCQVIVRDSTVKAGTGGGVVPDINVPPQQLTLPPSPARHLEVSSPVKNGNPGTIRILGVTGDLAFLFLGPTINHCTSFSMEGSLLLGPGLLFGPVPLGPITDPGGLLQIPFVAPPLPPSAPDGFILPVQLAILSSSTGTLEGGTAFTEVK